MNTLSKPDLLARIDFTNPRIQRSLVITAGVVLSVGFILFGYITGQKGFPLDDSWIHQTYARNFAATGVWDYIPGYPSAGSTSPLWTMVLSLGYGMGLKTPYFWTTLVSSGLFVGLGVLNYEILSRQIHDQKFFALGCSILMMLDWHLLWSAGSGMETLLFCLVGNFVFLLLSWEKRWFWLGVLCGVIVWVRPDGITFIGPVLFVMGWRLLERRLKSKVLINFLFPFISLVLLYGLFNYSLSGSFLPNTYFAKQLEYSSQLSLPLIIRLKEIFLVPIIGAGIFLLPGFFFSIYRVIKTCNIWLLSAIFWFLGYGLVYALRLPMVYQHGRYLFPLIPVYYFIGFIGCHELINWLITKRKHFEKLVRLMIVCAFACGVLFYCAGEKSFKDDINTIELLMVQPADWIRQNTAEDSIIAAHDIGALGYFGERKIIDLAGLIQPEVIPIIRNEEKLIEYIATNQADYLVVFSDWYSSLAQLGLTEKTFTKDTITGQETVIIQKLLQ